MDGGHRKLNGKAKTHPSTAGPKPPTPASMASGSVRASTRLGKMCRWNRIRFSFFHCGSLDPSACRIVLQYLCLSSLLSYGSCPYVDLRSVSRAWWPPLPACQLPRRVPACGAGPNALGELNDGLRGARRVFLGPPGNAANYFFNFYFCSYSPRICIEILFDIQHGGLRGQEPGHGGTIGTAGGGRWLCMGTGNVKGFDGSLQSALAAASTVNILGRL
ncbi:hypothetical protein FB451DRAFT_1359026 [Mycena latifolia]|nr:hypothetical protein FB451DRAFT_1359026 [Mycena latifolia]